jgi:hypothetical protein
VEFEKMTIIKNAALTPTGSGVEWQSIQRQAQKAVAAINNNPASRNTVLVDSRQELQEGWRRAALGINACEVQEHRVELWKQYEGAARRTLANDPQGKELFADARPHIDAASQYDPLLLSKLAARRIIQMLAPV